MYKHLVQETRLKTLELYKSLLKSSKPYDNLENAIRQQFKSNKYTTSRKKTLALLKEADETLNYLDRGNNGDQQIASKVNAYVQKYMIPKPLPKAHTKKQKQTKLVARKPYQVAITVRHALGFVFKRVRGWRQPVKTSMMACQLQLEMIKGEKLFLNNLGCLPKDRLKNYEENIKLAMAAYRKKQPLAFNPEDQI